MIINNTLQGVAGVYSNSGSVNKVARAYRQEEQLNDNIQISSQGQQFSEIMKKLKAGSDVRMDKVAECDIMFASGAYQVSSRDLAEKILQYRY